MEWNCVGGGAVSTHKHTERTACLNSSKCGIFMVLGLDSWTKDCSSGLTATSGRGFESVRACEMNR